MRLTYRRVLEAVAMLLFCIFLSGCGSLKLHSEVRDRQGMEASDAWKKVDLKSLITIERTNLDRLLQAELATQDKVVAGIRDQALRGVVFSADTFAISIQSPLKDRLKVLAGTSSGYLSDTIANARREKSIQKIQEARHTLFERNELDVPGCPELDGDKTPGAITTWSNRIPAPREKSLVTNTVKLIRGLCKAMVSTKPEGKIKEAISERDREVAELKDLRDEATALQKAYTTALKSYRAAVTATEAGESSLAAQIQEKSELLDKATKALEKSSNALSISFLSSERIDKIQAFVKAVTETTTGSPPPVDASEVAVAFIVIPKLFDDARKAMREARKPLVLPLLIRLNYEKLNLEAAKRDIASREAVIKLSQELVDALLLQSTELNLASLELESASVPDGTPFVDAFKGRAANADELWRGTTRYLDAINRLEADVRKIEYRRIAVYHDRALTYAEINAQQWDSLIGVSVEQLAAYSQSGIKAESLTGLLNGLGLLWIGAGVNK